jgi:DNA topoisomerase-1
VLDRLFGYRLSPVLWKKVMPRISAGRVQSVATRLIVEKERERMAFISSAWWDLTAKCELGFNARLLSVDGKRVATTADFGADGAVKEKSLANILLLDESAARSLVAALKAAPLVVKSMEESPRTERPKPPFTTSTMQQDAGSRLGWGAQITMRIAQRLYENGYITYMRTDSVNLSAQAITAARESAKALYGADHVAEAPRVYVGKTKNAQEAHEAIRPAGESFKTPGELAPELSRDEFALYDLIWKRTVASQMADAKKMQMRVDFDVKTSDSRETIFRANGSVITFPGFLAAYDDLADEKEGEESEDKRLPAMNVGQSVKVEEYSCEGHETKPPARYTEPTLVKKLEELGIGRPSTFASIIATIQDRGYVSKRGRALVPTFLAFSVTGLLETHFTKLVDYEFTASMEEDLDKIASGQAKRVDWLRDFFYGHDGEPGLNELSADLGAIDAREVNTMRLSPEIEIRVGRYGAYLQEGEGDTRKLANVPESLAPDELTLAKAIELLAAPSGERDLGIDPATNLPIIAKSGRFGPYVTEVFPVEPVVEGAKKKRKKADDPKPKTASLLSTMTLDTISSLQNQISNHINENKERREQISKLTASLEEVSINYKECVLKQQQIQKTNEEILSKLAGIQKNKGDSPDLTERLRVMTSKEEKLGAFVSKMKQINDSYETNLCCLICMQIVNKATLIYPCGHVFCDACVAPGTKSCGQCHKPAQTILRMAIIDEIAGKFRHCQQAIHMLSEEKGW